MGMKNDACIQGYCILTSLQKVWKQSKCSSIKNGINIQWYKPHNGVLHTLKKEQALYVQICNDSQDTITSELSNEQKSKLIKIIMMIESTKTPYEVFLPKTHLELIKL